MVRTMKLYHISQNPKLTTLIPSRPKNSWTEYGIEDGIHKRVSFAPTIMGCVRGVDDMFGKGEVYYVYVPTSLSPKYIVKPTMRQVPDVNHTHEIWYTKPVNVKLVGAIEIQGPTSYKEIPIMQPKGRLSMKVYNYEYKKLKKPTYDPYAQQEMIDKIKSNVLKRVANFYSSRKDSLEQIELDAIKLIPKAKVTLRHPEGWIYGKLIIYNIAYNGEVIGKIEKEKYLDGTSLAEGFYINPQFRNKGIGSYVLQLKEFRGSFIAPGNNRVRSLYRRLSEKSWKNFSESEKEQWREMYRKHRGMFKLR